MDPPATHLVIDSGVTVHQGVAKGDNPSKVFAEENPSSLVMSYRKAEPPPRRLRRDHKLADRDKDRPELLVVLLFQLVQSP